MTDEAILADLRVSADYQFGSGVGDALFPPDEPITIRRSSGGRPRQVLAGDVDDTPGSPAGDRLVTYGTDGRFTLGEAGARRLRRAFPEPTHRVVVGDESEPFIREGRNAFAKFVQSADPALRPGDEALVVHEDGYLLAVGRAELSASAMRDFETGMAVAVREGAA